MIKVLPKYAHKKNRTEYLTVDFHQGTHLATVTTENTTDNPYIVNADQIHEHIWRHEVTNNRIVARCSCGMEIKR